MTTVARTAAFATTALTTLCLVAWEAPAQLRAPSEAVSVVEPSRLQLDRPVVSMSPPRRDTEVAELLRAIPPGPDPAAVIRATKWPYSWVRGHGHALLLYVKPPRNWWPSLDLGPRAVSLVNREGRVLERWALPRSWGERVWSPARGGFVALGRDYPADHPVFINAHGVRSLTWVRGKRHYRPGDIRFGDGRLLNLVRNRVTTERLPRSCRGDATVDLHGRVWCLDGPRRTVSWTDNGTTWARHRLSTGYRWDCDGGTHGSELALLGDSITIGLWRADFSTDRGRTWDDVDLPFAAVGASDGIGTGYAANCTHVDLLRGGRLHLSYFKHAVATGSDNTKFTNVRAPRAAAGILFSAVEGILVAPKHRYGDILVSYDAGRHWAQPRIRALLRHIFAR